MMDIITFFQYLILFLLAMALVTGLSYLLSDGADITLLFYSRFGKPVEYLKGDVVWITGASSGIGESLAYRLAKAGCKLVLSARREDQLVDVKNACLRFGSLGEDDILVLPMDVLDFDNHETYFQRVIDHFGKLDILVNNAGRSQRCKWTDITTEVDRQVFELNVFSVISLSRVVLPYFNERNKGIIAVTSSTAGKMGSPFSGSYTGSKHALHGYFETLRLEDGLNSNVRVCMLCLGPVFTNALHEAFTGKTGEKFGEAWSPTDNRLSAERAAELYGVTLANRIDEVFIAPNAVLIFMILFTYFPSTMRSMFRLLRGYSSKIAAKLRDNKPAEAFDAKN